jgi:hypothetical protein
VSKRGIIILAMTVGFLLSCSSLTYADPEKGMRVYKKFMKKVIGIDGGKFAARHTQEEWRAMFANHAEAFKEETAANFGSAKEFLEGERFIKLQDHLRDFFIKYAVDSGNIPAC